VNGRYVDLGDLDGTQGWVWTSGFVAWVEDLNSHVPCQRVRLVDDSTEEPVVCTVWTDDVALEKGAGYNLTGADATYEKYNEIQLQVGESSEVEQFHAPDE
jgi:hypothetical protein